jgi:hypothetical protein
VEGVLAELAKGACSNIRRVCPPCSAAAKHAAGVLGELEDCPHLGRRTRGDPVTPPDVTADSESHHAGNADGLVLSRNYSKPLVGHRRPSSSLRLSAALAMRGWNFSRYSKAVAPVKGMPSRLIFPAGVHHVQQMLDLVGLTISQRRDMLMCALGTVMCMRVNEVDQLQICDPCHVVCKHPSMSHLQAQTGHSQKA